MGERRLYPGDTMILYTDGVTESFDDSGEEFCQQRLADLLERNNNLPAQALVSAIVEESPIRPQPAIRHYPDRRQMPLTKQASEQS